MVTLHDHARFNGRLAGADVADAIDGCQAVVAVATQAEAAAACGLDVSAQQGDQQGVAGVIGNRPSIYYQSHREIPSSWVGFIAWRVCYHFCR